jgi:hypothetical protein
MTVADRSSGYCSIALDSQQHPHIAFLDGRVKYAHWNGTAWKVEPLSLGVKLVEYYTSIAVDTEDHPIISFYEVLSNTSPDFILRLRTVKFTGQAWELSTVDRGYGSGKFNSLAVGSDGVAQVAYANVKDETAGLRYARQVGNSWETTVLEGGVRPIHMYSIQLVLDRANKPHITYTDAVQGVVKYARVVGKKWEFLPVDKLERMAFPDRNGIALDDAGNPYVSYYDAGLGVLKVAHLEGDRWIAETVDNSFSGFTSSIRIVNDEIVVMYYDTANNSLKCARRSLKTSPIAGSAPSGGLPLSAGH